MVKQTLVYLNISDNIILASIYVSCQEHQHNGWFAKYSRNVSKKVKCHHGAIGGKVTILINLHLVCFGGFG